jgi:hypothetical protein
VKIDDAAVMEQLQNMGGGNEAPAPTLGDMAPAPGPAASEDDPMRGFEVAPKADAPKN